MSIDLTYIKSALETLIIIQHLFNYLKETQTTNKFENNLSQIEVKADARVHSFSGQKQEFNKPVTDQEGKSLKYWEGVRDMARHARKKWLGLQDQQKFSVFLKDTQTTLSGMIKS